MGITVKCSPEEKKEERALIFFKRGNAFTLGERRGSGFTQPLKDRVFAFSLVP